MKENWETERSRDLCFTRLQDPKYAKESFFQNLTATLFFAIKGSFYSYFVAEYLNFHSCPSKVKKKIDENDRMSVAKPYL